MRNDARKRVKKRERKKRMYPCGDGKRTAEQLEQACAIVKRAPWGWVLG